MEDSLKNILSTSKTDQNKWEEFKEKMKYKVNRSLVLNKTLIIPELSHVHEPEPVILLPTSHQINELLNGKSIIENPNLIDVNQINNICHIPSSIIEDRLPTILSPNKLLYNGINTMNQYEQDQNNIQK